MYYYKKEMMYVVSTDPIEGLITITEEEYIEHLKEFDYPDEEE